MCPCGGVRRRAAGSYVGSDPRVDRAAARAARGGAARQPGASRAAATYRAYRASEMQGALAIDATQERPPAETIGAVRSERVMLLVSLSAAAGVIHAKALFDHASHYW